MHSYVVKFYSLHGIGSPKLQDSSGERGEERHGGEISFSYVCNTLLKSKERKNKDILILPSVRSG